MSRRGPDPRVTWIVDFMQRHMAEPLSIATLADHVNLSRSRFTTLFVAQTGVAPMRYLQRARLRRARLLVERTFLSAKEIMAVVGYNDPSHFARDFHREHGVPPSALRSGELTTPLPASSSDDSTRRGGSGHLARAIRDTSMRDVDLANLLKQILAAL